MKSVVDMSTDVGLWLTEELVVVSSVMSTHLEHSYGAVNDVCNSLATYKGKMLRPSLVLLSWKMVSEEADTPDGVYAAAAVLELIHLATLVHDDVLDDADLRRGKQTINSLLGNEAAVILGDYLLSSAFHLCSTIRNPKLNLLLGEVTNTLCAGEMVQLFHRNNVDLGLDLYYQIVHDKTASLISASCEMGGILGGGSGSDVSVLKEFGSAVGTAFQIKDDLLDLLGEKTVLGKPAGRDLEKGKLTLPIISMLAGSPELKPQVLEAINQNDRYGLRSMLDSSGAITSSIKVVHNLVDSATSSIRASFNNEATEQLCALAQKLKQDM